MSNNHERNKMDIEEISKHIYVLNREVGSIENEVKMLKWLCGVLVGLDITIIGLLVF